MSSTQKIHKVALIGNPNSGKSSLFNALTGLNQKISNYPGVTVDKKSGRISLSSGDEVELIDFPGIYSLYPNSSDEKIVVEVLTNIKDSDYPDAIIYVAASQELEKHFLLASQIRELGIPTMFCMTMMDLNESKGISYDLSILEDYLQMPVIEVSTLKGINLDGLKYKLIELFNKSTLIKQHQNRYKATPAEKEAIISVSSHTATDNDYQNLLVAHHHEWLNHLSAADRIQISSSLDKTKFESTRLQINETLSRYNSFSSVIEKAEVRSKKERQSLTEKIDNVITHRVLGPVIFFGLMLFIFQAIFAWSEAPMGWIESGFASLSSWTQQVLPSGWFTDLLTEGIIAGLGGVLVFIPQITILFLLVTALEEVGYMSRAVFMFDGVMQRFGLNGRSIVALISSGACAIPAIMSTRTISNWKERLITILVSPLISCSARIPVYAVLIGFVVPSKSVGIFNLQGLAFMGLYVLSIVAALFSAWVFKKILKSDERSFLMIELPQYKQPLFKNVLLTVKEKVTTFIVEAGQVILVISVVLWFLASYGPSSAMSDAISSVQEVAVSQNLDEEAADNLLASAKLEASYAGHLGKFIEPAIRPLGFDWKIGISLITSFAAREVFVGTMATIYSIGSSDDEATVRERMAQEINPITGGPRYDVPTALSLLLFYVFAMQCMSTLAVTKRETKSWKWPMVQLGFMSVLAYVSSMIAFQLLV